MYDIPSVEKYRQECDPFLHTTEREARAEAAKVDEAFVMSLIATQHQLEKNQRLVLAVSARLPQGVEEGDLEGYEGVINDAPFNFRRHLEELVDRENHTIEGYTKGEDFPDGIEISIPPDIIPEEDYAANSSDSRAALFGGQVRRFLDSFTARDIYLSIKPTGLFLGRDLIFHPSLISNIEIRNTDLQQNFTPICSFKAMKG